MCTKFVFDCNRFLSESEEMSPIVLLLTGKSKTSEELVELNFVDLHQISQMARRRTASAVMDN